MRRNFNYTGRRRIERSDVEIRRRDALHEDPEIEVQLHLAEYDFASSARVYIEAYASVGTTAWQRFDVAKPFDSTATQVFTLTGFADVPRVTFTIRAVEPSSNRLLGLAEAIPWTNLIDDVADVEGLLPVQSQDIGELVWDLQFDKLERPVLLVSDRLWRHRSKLFASQHFKSMVLPEVLRKVLSEALDESSGFDVDAPDDHWFGDWIAWMRVNRELLPHAEALTTLRSDDKQSWVADVVRDFAGGRRCQFARRLERHFEEEAN